MSKHFYAIEYGYGSNVLNHGAGRADKVMRFDSEAERDEWVSQGNPQVGPGERAALRSSHKLIRRVNGRQYAKWYWENLCEEGGVPV